MTELASKRIKALRMNSSFCNDTDDEVVSYLLYKECADKGIVDTIAFFSPEEDDYLTLGFVQRVYAEGYDAIINDGELIGFKKAV